MGNPTFSRVFQKVIGILDCRIFKSSLFYSDITNGKKDYVEVSVLL